MLKRTADALRVVAIAATLFVMTGTDGAEDKGGTCSTSLYPSLLHDGAYDIVFARVLSAEPADADMFPHYRIKAVGDLRGAMKPDEIARVRGLFEGAGTHVLMFDVPPSAGQTCVLVLKRSGRAWGIEPYPMKYYPFGVSSTRPSVPEDRAVDVLAAFAELRAALSVAGGDGPSHDRAVTLTKDHNPYLWSLGCWRLAHGANRWDVDQLASLAHDQGGTLTAEQALFLDDLFDHITSNTVDPDTIPNSDARRELLRQTLERYTGVRLPPPSRPATVPAGGAPALPGDPSASSGRKSGS